MQVGSEMASSNKPSRTHVPDLFTNECPVGCGNCAGVYVNEVTGHRIVCHCRACGHTRS
jgi:hypothetical protein